LLSHAHGIREELGRRGYNCAVGNGGLFVEHVHYRVREPWCREFEHHARKALTISPGQLLAATKGVTPVAFGKPAHGNIAYGAYRSMIYTPDATPPFALKPKMLPNGTQDSGEVLIADTTRLPATTESVTVPIKVG
jgi:hypothetical protein